MAVVWADNTHGNHSFTLTKPFYYGRAEQGMVFILMFHKTFSQDDQIRFSLFKFKVPRHPRPAWDFQYVINKV